MMAAGRLAREASPHDEGGDQHGQTSPDHGVVYLVIAGNPDEPVAAPLRVVN
jgi:hypothetical protein